MYRALKKENVKVCYKPTSTLSQQFTKPKDKLPPDQTNGVVYKICCDDVILCTMVKPTEHSLLG